MDTVVAVALWMRDLFCGFRGLIVLRAQSGLRVTAWVGKLAALPGGIARSARARLPAFRGHE